MGQRSRTGFSKRSDQPEWVVEGNRLVWARSSRPSADISELPTLPDHWVDLEETSIEAIPKTEKLQLLKILQKHPNPPLNEMDRIQVIAGCSVIDMKKYIRAGEIILSSLHWSDAEKIKFLAGKLSKLPGLKYGRDVQKLLYRVRWQDSSFRSRMTRYHELLCRAASESKSLLEDLNRRIGIDRSIVDDMKGDVLLYRGFNVPADLSVRERNVRSWDRQDEGRGVYFSLSEKWALAFACLQKSSYAAKLINGNRLDSKERKILGGTIAVGKYKIPIDRIILYHHAIGRQESECICKPSDASLIHYKFYGFDHFKESLGSFPEIVTRLDALSVEALCELAFATNPKRKRARPSQTHS
jgi:hypothetical protein